jgi:hypothetical protein
VRRWPETGNGILLFAYTRFPTRLNDGKVNVRLYPDDPRANPPAIKSTRREGAPGVKSNHAASLTGSNCPTL